MAEILDKGQLTIPTLSTANEPSDDDLLQVDPAEFMKMVVVLLREWYALATASLLWQNIDLRKGEYFGSLF